MILAPALEGARTAALHVFRWRWNWCVWRARGYSWVARLLGGDRGFGLGRVLAAPPFGAGRFDLRWQPGALRWRWNWSAGLARGYSWIARLVRRGGRGRFGVLGVTASFATGRFDFDGLQVVQYRHGKGSTYGEADRALNRGRAQDGVAGGVHGLGSIEQNTQVPGSGGGREAGVAARDGSEEGSRGGPPSPGQAFPEEEVVRQLVPGVLRRASDGW
jgi:hypothetical protein